MSAFQGKGGALVVVEFPWFPARCVVAAGTADRILAGGKLIRMRVVMAFGALLWCSAEVHVFQTGLQSRGTVAVAAAYSTMRAQEREFRL